MHAWRMGVDEDVVRPAGILGSAGRSNFVVWMMLNGIFVVMKVESKEE